MGPGEHTLGVISVFDGMTADKEFMSS